MKKRTKRLIIAGCILLPLLIFTVWLFQTGEPSYKTYSPDGQYSYYTADYNFNKIPFISIFYAHDWGFGACTHCYYKRKIFLYDEVTQKVLYSKYTDRNSYEMEKSNFFEQTVFRHYYDENNCYRWALPRPMTK